MDIMDIMSIFLCSTVLTILILMLTTYRMKLHLPAHQFHFILVCALLCLLIQIYTTYVNPNPFNPFAR